MSKYKRAKLLIASCQLPIDLPNVQVSDTTGDDSSNAAGTKNKYKKIIAISNTSCKKL